ncbi:hypothetical protein MXD81_01250 [Microbacteriaceae bacterium K1510]|nr:hypothetical protein [Microbacteriaceae bacterium K1510]
MSDHSERKPFLLAFSALVVGSMIGARILSPPNTFGAAAGPFGAIIALCITAGVLAALARVFEALTEWEPELDAGVYACGCAAKRVRRRSKTRLRYTPQ